MSEGALTGGQLARLDELADLTREHARIGSAMEQGLCLLLCAPWMGFAEAVFWEDPAWGRVAYSAGALLAMAAWAMVRRSPLMPAVAHRAADEVERGGRRRLQWAGVGQGILYAGLVGFAMYTDASASEVEPSTALVWARWVTLGLLAGAALAFLRWRRWDGVWLAVMFLTFATASAHLGAGAAGSMRTRDLALTFHWVKATWALALGVVGYGVLLRAQRRRQGLDHRLALLKEHAG